MLVTRELTSYSDAELAELGIARPDVPRIAMRGAFAKAKPPTASADASVNPLTERKSARPKGTVRYLGIEVDDALAIAEQVEV